GWDRRTRGGRATFLPLPLLVHVEIPETLVADKAEPGDAGSLDHRERLVEPFIAGGAIGAELELGLGIVAHGREAGRQGRFADPRSIPEQVAAGVEIDPVNHGRV